MVISWYTYCSDQPVEKPVAMGDDMMRRATVTIVSLVLSLLVCVPPCRAADVKVTVKYDWSDRTPEGVHSNHISMGGPLLSGRSGGPPGPKYRGSEKRVNGKTFIGLQVFDAENLKSPVIEVFVHGEESTVLILATSKVPFKIVVSHDRAEHLAWTESGKRKEGPIELLPGQHEIEIVGVAAKGESEKESEKKERIRGDSVLD
jgi:hypothetical protein